MSVLTKEGSYLVRGAGNGLLGRGGVVGGNSAWIGEN